MILTCTLIAILNSQAFLKCDHDFKDPMQEGVVSPWLMLPRNYMLGQEFKVKWDGERVLKVWREV